MKRGQVTWETVKVILIAILILLLVAIVGLIGTNAKEGVLQFFTRFT